MKQTTLQTFFSLVFLGFAVASAAQIPTFSKDIAQLIYDNCASCHHEGGLAPFPLITYSDVSVQGINIQHAVNEKHMPPWPPDSDYQTYSHDRSLEDDEIQKINDWVNAGMPLGDIDSIPAPPTFNQGSFLGTPDLKLTIPVYTSKASAVSDDYVCFSIPTGLVGDRFLKAIEVVPGNPAIVHHVLVFKDDFGTYATDTAGFCTGPTTGLIAGYAPGELPMVYPNGGTVKMGSKIKAGSNIILAMHYPNGSAGQVDSTSVHLFFYDQATTGIREVTAQGVLQDFSFCIDSGAVQTVSNSFPPGAGGTNIDYSLLSVFPHAHLLGKEYKIYATTPTNDTIPIIHIPQWDFHWQGFYLFKNIIKLPQGSHLRGWASYDNTDNNPNNPNFPPQEICAGFNTTDEMFLVYFQFLSYQNGDENIDLEAFTNFTTNTTPIQEPQTYWQAYPNPFNQNITVDYELRQSAEVEFSVYNMQGQLLHRNIQGNQPAGWHQTQWQGASQLTSGAYMVRLQVGNEVLSKCIVKF